MDEWNIPSWLDPQKVVGAIVVGIGTNLVAELITRLLALI